MADEHQKSNAASDSDTAASEPSDDSGASDSDNIQSLTDLFDQMDRAAFKRALENRDAQRENDTNPPKRQRR